MRFFVYLIISINKNKTLSYVGFTNNLAKRIKLHNESKGAKFTRGRTWKVIHHKCYSSKSAAMKSEYKLKKNYILRNKIKNAYLNNVKFKKN